MKLGGGPGGKNPVGTKAFIGGSSFFLDFFFFFFLFFSFVSGLPGADGGCTR